MRIEAAGATDVGQVRRINQDAYLLGYSAFAVADGMGGHQAGEVASAAALEPVAELDGRVFADPEAARQALVDAFVTANRMVTDMSADDPDYRGMGTTLTAVLFEGRRLHLGHTGDSRAYLVRDGQLRQLTTDHTLVQHLIDEGQITPAEAAIHPQRSIITRAIGVAADVQVDTETFEIQSGDRLLLCSDGLTGVVPDEQLAQLLLEVESPQALAETLIERANAGGGHDNITAVVVDFVEEGAGTTTAGASASVAGDGQDRAPLQVRTSETRSGDDWARRLSQLGALGSPEDPDAADTGPRRATAIAIAVVLLLVLAGLGGRWLLSRSYYVGLQHDRVAIYQGVPVELGPLNLSWVVERTSVHVDELPAYYVEALRDGIPAIDRRDARLIIENRPQRPEGTTPAQPSPSPSPTETPATP